MLFTCITIAQSLTTSNNLITEYTHLIIPKSLPHKLPIKKFFFNLLNCRNLGEKRQIISYLEIRLNVITESGRIGIKPITYLLLGCSTGGVEDEVPEGEAVALLCLRDEDRLWRRPSGNHGAYESLVTVTLLKERKNSLWISRPLEVLLEHVLIVKEILLIWYMYVNHYYICCTSFCTYTHKMDTRYC